MSLNDKEIMSMLRYVNDSDYGFFNLEDENFELTVVKKDMDLSDIKDIMNGTAKNGETNVTNQVPLQQTKSNEATSSTMEANVTNEQKETVSTTTNVDTYTINAPMVGTFFSKPSPEEPEYVQVGDTVDAGDTVCLIEVMKLFNSVPAEEKGRIVEMLVTDGELVEYDQPLFVIEKANAGSVK